MSAIERRNLRLPFLGISEQTNGPCLTRLSAIRFTFASALLLSSSYAFTPNSQAQVPPAPASDANVSLTNSKLNLAADSPFRNPDIIYLEADTVQDDRDKGIITATGSVQGRYQDRSVRADHIVYNVNSGRVVATGNVYLTEGDGSIREADRLELDDQLGSAKARDFKTELFPVGTAGAKYAVRRPDGGFDLYNAYYTACKTCIDENTSAGSKNSIEKMPTWRIRARKVSQDKENQMVRYRDAVFQVKGMPVFYLPYMAHPDPSIKRSSGLLLPYAGSDGALGAFYEQPYFWAADDYTDVIVTPRIFANVAPVAETQILRKFHSGTFSLNASGTSASFFDGKGNELLASEITTPETLDLSEDKFRGHIFAHGHFNLTDTFSWGFGYEDASDDFYLDRYNIDHPSGFGLYDGGSRRFTQQIFGVAQRPNFRYSVSAYDFSTYRSQISRLGNQVTLTGEDQDLLPRVLPRIEASHYFEEPIFGGRLHAFADYLDLERDISGTVTTPVKDDYERASFGLEYSKSTILPNGIETKPFAMIRHDSFDISPLGAPVISDERTVGQIGLDSRWTFIRHGAHVDLSIEPRVQITHNFGDEQLTDIANYREDSISGDLDSALLWAPIKATGYDLFETGTRTDIGAKFGADWNGNSASIFVGQSFSDTSQSVFRVNSGFGKDRSDIIAETSLSLGSFNLSSRVRYDDDQNILRRTDTSVSYSGNKLSLSGRHYKIDDTGYVTNSSLLSAPKEEIRGSVEYQFLKHFKGRYSATYDVDADYIPTRTYGIVYDDDCTMFEIFYQQRQNSLGLVRNSDSFGVRIELLTLGGLE